MFRIEMPYGCELMKKDEPLKAGDIGLFLTEDYKVKWFRIDDQSLGLFTHKTPGNGIFARALPGFLEGTHCA